MDVFLYILLGITLSILAYNLKSPGKRIEHNIARIGPLNSEDVVRSIGQLLGPPIVAANKIQHLYNGDQIFPSMISAIQEAKISINFETFIYWSGDIGKKFADELSKKARAGVEVHVLLDWLGSRQFEDEYIQKMKDAGVLVERYRPIRWYNISRFNNRTHRKILVIDGKIGFTGGVGIADQWQGHAQDKDHWRDSHFRVEGPVVAQLQAAFMDNWNSTHPDVLHGVNYFPKLSEQGDHLAQVFKSSPEEGSDSVRLMYLYSFVHAMKYIKIASAYFVPDVHVRNVLIEAARKGIKIEVIVPGKYIDTALTRRASRAVWGKMLEAGIKIYEYQPTMYHSKYMIVDDIWLSVGSTNMDNRSFRLNDECNLNVLNAELALEMAQIFEKDKARAKEITFAEWKNRPLREKIIEKTASLFRSQV